MVCKYCEPEVHSKTGEPQLDENGEQYFHCSIDCLPIRGRLQRLIYSLVYDDTKIAEIVRRAQLEDANIAQSNVSRALSNLKKLGYIREGQNVDGIRVFARSSALDAGELDDCSFTLEKVNPEAKMLRHLLIWVISRQEPDNRGWCELSDKTLSNAANIVLTQCDDGGFSDLSFGDVFELMEPIVKKLRYIIRGFTDKSFPISKSIGKAEKLENWENRTLTPLRKLQKPRKGWLAYHRFFQEEWNRLCKSCEAHPDTVRFAAGQIKHEAAVEDRARKRFAQMTLGKLS